ncbi:MAG: hypothetical protein ACXWKP_26940 [Bradyrhizobium sp.]
MFSQAFFTEGRATFFKLQSAFGLVRTFGASEQLAWMLQWMMSGTVLALAQPRRDGAGDPGRTVVADRPCRGLPTRRTPWIGLAIGLLIAFPFLEIPLGLGSTLIVAALIVRRVVNPSAEQRILPSESPALG